MCQHLRACQIVDCYNLITFCSEHLSECQTTDTAKTINCYSYCHFSFLLNLVFLLLCYIILSTKLDKIDKILSTILFYPICPKNSRRKSKYFRKWPQKNCCLYFFPASTILVVAAVKASYACWERSFPCQSQQIFTYILLFPGIPTRLWSRWSSEGSNWD